MANRGLKRFRYDKHNIIITVFKLVDMFSCVSSQLFSPECWMENRSATNQLGCQSISCCSNLGKLQTGSANRPVHKKDCSNMSQCLGLRMSIMNVD